MPHRLWLANIRARDSMSLYRLQRSAVRSALVPFICVDLKTLEWTIISTMILNSLRNINLQSDVIAKTLTLNSFIHYTLYSILSTSFS